MTNCLPHSSKKLAILLRRELASFTLIEESAAPKKIVDAAERVRDARIRAICKPPTDTTRTVTVYLLIVLPFCVSCGQSPSVTPALEAARRAGRDGDPDRAAEIYSAYLADHPDDVEALRERGGVYLGTGDPNQALADLDRALKIAPDDGIALNNRAQVFRNIGRTEEAIVDFEGAIVCGFDNADLRNDLALLYSSIGKKHEAIRHYGEAIHFDPREVVFHLNRGVCLVDVGDFDKAIADFTAAIALAPDDHRPYALRYNAHVYNSEMDKARLDGAEAHRLNPNWSMPESADSASEESWQISEDD